MPPRWRGSGLSRRLRPRADWISFTVAFKGVLLEGLEVAFIVVTFGPARTFWGLAAIGAALRASWSWPSPWSCIDRLPGSPRMR